MDLDRNSGLTKPLSIWRRSRTDAWAFIESPPGRTIELVAAFGLTVYAITRYPENASALVQGAIQASVLLIGLISLGVAVWLGYFLVETPHAIVREINTRDAARRRRKPLSIVLLDTFDGWERLIIDNPNEYVVTGAYARLVASNTAALPVGFNFHWSTLETDTPTRRISFAANDGQRALDLFRKRDGNVVFMQLNPLKEDGYQLSELVRVKPPVHIVISLEADDGSVPRSVHGIAVTWDDPGWTTSFFRPSDDLLLIPE